ncbi:CPSF A subunit region-domain-containing protein [Lentinula edodes]|nr:CPSF A subunit region-domain-containing protein [Lentinula edodes]
MSTRITSTFHPSSSIISSVKCSLISPDLSHLVVAKLNSVSVYSILESGLQLECSVGVRGKVRVVRAVPIQNSHRSNLLILLDHPDPEILIFTYTETSEPGTATLNLKHQIPLDERGSRPSELCTDAIVHPSGVFGVVSCYTGKLKVVMMESGEVFGLQCVAIPELNLLSYTFLPLVHEDNYALALLYIDYKEHIQLVSRNLRISPSSESNADLDISSYSHLLPPTTISYKHLPNPAETAVHLIPIPPDEDYMYDMHMHMDEDEHETDVFLGGILVVGGRKVLLYELTSQETREFKPVKGKGKRKRDSKKQKQIDAPTPTPNTDSGSSKQKNLNEIKKRDPRATVEWPWSWVTAYVFYEDESSHKILIGDAFGRLAMLSLFRFKDFGMALIPLGETSPPTSLTYLSNQITFVGSHLGDSQLVRISQVALSTAKESLTLPIPESVGTRISVEDGSGGSGSGGKGIKKGWIVATHGSFIEVIQRFKNIAPIRDAVLADLDGSGQSHIVTCSGGGNAGSVNIVRIGADFEETASVQGVEGVIDMWPVRLSYGTALHSYFITTTLLSTHVFHLTSTSTSNPNPTQLECVDTSHDFILPNQTLYIGNMALKTAGKYDEDSALVVQVVPEAAVLLQYEGVLGRWTCVDRVDADADKGGSGSGGGSEGGSGGGSRGKFVKASGNASQLLIAQAGGWVAVYTVQMREGKLSPSLFPSPPPPSWYNTEISALTCPLLDPSKHFTRLIAAAFWHTNQLALYTFNTPTQSTQSTAELELLCQSPLGALTSPVRAVVMGFMSVGRYRVEDRESHLCVFAGLADGGVVSTRIKVPRLKDMNIISLGNTPVSFTQYEADGRRVVVAAGSRAVVFSWEGSHLRSAPVVLKDITAVTTLNTENYPNSLMLATDFGISIGRVRSLEKMHIRSTSLGLHTPRHIVHEPTHRVFGVGTVYTEPCRVGEEEKTMNSVKLLDDTTLEVLAQAELQQDEQIMSLAVLQVNDHHNHHHHNNNNNTSQQQHLLCVGTFSLRLDETEPTSGKILLFEIQHASSTLIQLKRVAAEDVGGCVYSLVVIDGLLAAAINSSVSLYRVSSITEDLNPSTPSYTIHSMMEWNHNYMVTSLSAYRNHLVVADQFSSVSLLRLEEEDGDDDDDDDDGGSRKLVTVARDYSPLWPVCVEAVDDKSFIGADQSLNMFTFSLSGSTTNNRTILVRDGFYHVGDLITKFIRGSLATTTNSAPGRFKSTHIFCTLSGQIGVITSVENDIVLSRFLSALELQLGQKSISAGGVSHAKHRAPRLSRGRSDADSAAYGILDGDLLEQMLTYMNTDPELAEEIYTLSVADDDDLPYTLAELKKDLELLQNMH